LTHVALHFTKILPQQMLHIYPGFIATPNFSGCNAALTSVVRTPAVLLLLMVKS
jgi:hypothetical protein